MRLDLDALFYVPLAGPRFQPGSVHPSGGTETRMWLLTTELARRGRRIGVIVREFGEPLPPQVDGVHVLTVRQTGGGRLRPVRSIALMEETVRGVRTEALVQAGPSALPLLYLRLLAARRRARLVYATTSGTEVDPDRHPSKLIARLYHLGIRLADAVVVQHEEQAALIRSGHRLEPTVIPSITEAAELRSAEPGYFLWVGRVDPVKRPLEFVELARAVPDASFKMIAPETTDDHPGLAASVRDQVDQTRNLELLEPRAREQLWPLIEGAVAIVNTSEREGMPNVFLEGWARGVPALTLHHDPGGVISERGLGWHAGGSSAELVRLAGEIWSHRGEEQAELAARCRRYTLEEHSLGAAATAWERVLWPDR